jgi:uncharacterized protein involved in exopolysaccharide biosynthesis
MQLVDLALRHLRLILGFAAVLALLTVLVAFVSPRTYTSNASFLPQSSSRQSALSGVVAQLGLSTQSDQSGDSPDFYATISKSKQMMDRLVESDFEVRGIGVKRKLVDLLALSEPSGLSRHEAATRLLAKRTNVTVVPKIGLVRVAVTASDPALAQGIVAALLRLINQANLEIRRQRAAEEAHFIDERLSAARADLFGAEERLQGFLQSNRDLGTAGQSSFQRDRLQREVSMKQQIYTSLALAYEQSSLDEVRNTSVISVVDEPSTPPFPDSRHIGAKAMLAVLIGGLLGLLLSWMIESIDATAEDTRSDGEFRRLLRRMIKPFVRNTSPITHPSAVDSGAS